MSLRPKESRPEDKAEENPVAVCGMATIGIINASRNRDAFVKNMATQFTLFDALQATRHHITKDWEKAKTRKLRATRH